MSWWSCVWTRISHTHDAFIFKDKQTGKQTRYRKQTVDFTLPQEFFIAESDLCFSPCITINKAALLKLECIIYLILAISNIDPALSK